MWHTVHLVFYDSDKEQLLLDCVVPLLDEIRDRGWAERGFVRRHWKRGPHLRINVDTTAALFAEQVRPLLIGRCSEFLLANPSRHPLDPAEYLSLSRQLGAAELEPGPYEPLAPDNTVAEQPYDGREAVLGGPGPAERMAAYHADVHELVVELLRTTRGDKDERLMRLVSCMALVAHVHPHGGIKYGYLSYRSHSEAFLSTRSADMRARYERSFARNEERLTHMLMDLLAACEQQIYVGPDPFLAKWSQLHMRLYQEYITLVKSGELPEPEVAHGALTAQMGIRREGPGLHTEFHDWVWTRELDWLNTPEFTAYRWVLNAFYSLLPQLDIAAGTKYLLSYLVAEATERVLGVTWKQILGVGG